MVATDYQDIAVEVSGQIGIVKVGFQLVRSAEAWLLTVAVQSAGLLERFRRPTIPRNDKCLS